MDIKNILFVCTGNTCRSPMAMAIMRQYLQQQGIEGVAVDSAGLAAFGDKISRNAVQALNEIGIDLRGYVSKPVTSDLIQAADLIVVMSRGHRDALKNAGVEEEKIVVLGNGIADPYGGDLEIYRAARDEIKSAVITLAKERGLASG